MFSFCNLQPALLAHWPGSFVCHCNNTWVEWTLNKTKSQHRKLTLEKKKISHCSCQGLNPWLWIHRSTNWAISTSCFYYNCTFCFVIAVWQWKICLLPHPSFTTFSTCVTCPASMVACVFPHQTDFPNQNCSCVYGAMKAWESSATGSSMTLTRNTSAWVANFCFHLSSCRKMLRRGII